MAPQFNPPWSGLPPITLSPNDKLIGEPFMLSKADLSILNGTLPPGAKFTTVLLLPHDVLIDLGLLPWNLFEYLNIR